MLLYGVQFDRNTNALILLAVDGAVVCSHVHIYRVAGIFLEGNFLQILQIDCNLQKYSPQTVCFII